MAAGSIEYNLYYEWGYDRLQNVNAAGLQNN